MNNIFFQIYNKSTEKDISKIPSFKITSKTKLKIKINLTKEIKNF